MSNKSKNPPAGGNEGSDIRERRNNPEVDARIDAYIKENPKYWQYLQDTPKERLERMLVWKEVQVLDRQQRIQTGIMREINQNPEMKQAYDTLVRNVPEHMRESVVAQLARQTRRVVAQVQTQGGPAV